MVLLVRLVARPGKTAAVGEAVEQGKITPGAVGMDQFVKMSYRGVFVTPQKYLDFCIMSIFANVMLHLGREATQAECLRLDI